MPSGAPLVSLKEESDNNGYSYPVSDRIQSEESENNSDEFQRICSSFDVWLAAFRSTRPQRDVIWRVGNVYFTDHVLEVTFDLELQTLLF